MIVPSDTLDELITVCIQNEACEEAIIFLNECKDNNMTVSEMIKAGGKVTDGQEWALWIREVIWEYLAPSTRLEFSEMASRNDPRVAAYLTVFAKNQHIMETRMLDSRWEDSEFPNYTRRKPEWL